mmetsp:Transcript_1088/g.1708  ORF Transcript_1088/g.1708 Transcript_1088/m.1708 type:complete len:97 (-) Transcript_1088:1198-1488(-)
MSPPFTEEKEAVRPFSCPSSDVWNDALQNRWKLLELDCRQLRLPKYEPTPGPDYPKIDEGRQLGMAVPVHHGKQSFGGQHDGWFLPNPSKQPEVPS